MALSSSYAFCNLTRLPFDPEKHVFRAFSSVGNLDPRLKDSYGSVKVASFHLAMRHHSPGLFIFITTSIKTETACAIQ